MLNIILVLIGQLSIFCEVSSSFLLMLGAYLSYCDHSSGYKSSYILDISPLRYTYLSPTHRWTHVGHILSCFLGCVRLFLLLWFWLWPTSNLFSGIVWSLLLTNTQVHLAIIPLVVILWAIHSFIQDLCTFSVSM